MPGRRRSVPSSSFLNWLGLAPAAGSANPVHSLAGLITLLALQHFPLVLIIVQVNLRSMPADLIEAARVSGASMITIVRRLILPLLRPALIAALTLSFIAAIGNFGINAVIGVPARFTTLPVLIWQKLASFGPDVLPDVAAIATLLATLALILVLLSWWCMARARRAIPSAGSTLAQSRPARRGRPSMAEVLLWGFSAGDAALSTAVSAGHLAGAHLWCGTDTRIGNPCAFPVCDDRTGSHGTRFRQLDSGGRIGSNADRPARHPVGLRAESAARSGRFLATSAAIQADLAYAVPGIVMSVAFILAFLRPLPIVGISLYNTLTLIGLAYVAVFLAVGLKPVASAATALDEALDDAARVSGAGYLRRLSRIQAPCFQDLPVRCHSCVSDCL